MVTIKSIKLSHDVLGKKVTLSLSFLVKKVTIIGQKGHLSVLFAFNFKYFQILNGFKKNIKSENSIF